MYSKWTLFKLIIEFLSSVSCIVICRYGKGVLSLNTAIPFSLYTPKTPASWRLKPSCLLVFPHLDMIWFVPLGLEGFTARRHSIGHITPIVHFESVRYTEKTVCKHTLLWVRKVVVSFLIAFKICERRSSPGAEGDRYEHQYRGCSVPILSPGAHTGSLWEETFIYNFVLKLVSK